MKKLMMVSINGRRTSVRLEPEYIVAIKLIAKRRRKPLDYIYARANAARGRRESFTSRLRIYIMQQMIWLERRKK